MEFHFAACKKEACNKKKVVEKTFWEDFKLKLIYKTDNVI